PPAAPPPAGVLTVPGEAREAPLGGLRPWSRYRLRVLLFNGRGDGPPGKNVSFQTPEGGQRPPQFTSRPLRPPSVHNPPP
ncbi:NGCA protein, partial [Alcedo cyanopectus]|nr:NGCA protein [Ceyx cyanopectus]